MQHKIALRVSLCSLLCIYSVSAHAEHTSTDAHGIVSLVVENDLFANTDRGYTNGIRLSWLSPEGSPPDSVEWIADHIFPYALEGQKRGTFAIGQNMYTPGNIQQSPPNSKDQPYAGWLYATSGIVVDDGKKLDHYLLTLGVVGPYSYAENTQKFVHKVIDSPHPQGWAYQLKNEPGVVLTWERKWRNIITFTDGGLGMDISPNIGANLGNVHTDAAVGLTLRFGQDLPIDYGAPRIRPSLPGSDFFLPSDSLGWYVFAGSEARVVGRNIFLDGNTFRDSASVDKKYLVGNIQVGAALTYRNARLSYTQVFSSKEFNGQQGSPAFGAVTLSLRY